MEYPTVLFIYDYYCIVSDVIVTEADVIRLFLFVIMVHDVMEPWWVSGGHQGPDVVRLLPEFKFW